MSRRDFFMCKKITCVKCAWGACHTMYNVFFLCAFVMQIRRRTQEDPKAVRSAAKEFKKKNSRGIYIYIYTQQHPDACVNLYICLICVCPRFNNMYCLKQTCFFHTNTIDTHTKSAFNSHARLYEMEMKCECSWVIITY